MIRILLLAVTAVVFGYSVGNAQIIYSNYFNGGVTTIYQTAPTTANNLLGGSDSATWICTYTNDTLGPNNGTVLADGTIATNGGCALLPFTPQPGCVYVMNASLTVPAGMASWLAMGFSQAAGQTNNYGYARFTDSPVKGYAWINPQENHAWNFFAGPYTQNASPPLNPMPSEGTYSLTVMLNTIGAKWATSAYIGGAVEGTNIIGGTQIGTNFVYSANPSIGFAGIGQQTFFGKSIDGIKWNYWSLSVTQIPNITNSYWVAPIAFGTGDGSSSANAAGYLDAGFWGGVQALIQVGDVNVNFLNGTYNAGTLNLNDMGSPLHRLTLQAVNPNGPVFSMAGNTIVGILGSQNLKFDGLVFTGPVQYWGVNCQPDYLKPCRDLIFSHCQFINLTNVVYGAIGLVNGVRDVLVDNCTFSNLTADNGNHQHMIYASHDIVGVTVTNCLFQDCKADYVRFRDDSEYCRVQNCQFISTMSSTAWPFITAELYNETNSDSAGDEFFGTYFQISSNSFTYNVSGGPGPYSALHFSDTGYSPNSYHCALTPSEVSQLSSGTASFQQSFLQTNMGIVASGIKMFGNTYNSRVAYHMDYTYVWDGSAPYGGWQGTIKLDNVPDASGTPLGSIPKLRNADFDRRGLLLTPVSQGLKNWECLFRTWMCNPKYTDILQHSGFAGTTNALLFDKTQNQYVYQWISDPTSEWTMDCLFAVGSSSGSGTKFKVDILHNDIIGAKVSVGVNNFGQLGIYNGGTFIVLPTLGTVASSVDNNGNGNYTDSDDTLNVYHLRIVGNYAAGTPYVNLYVSDANSMDLTHQALGLTDWVNGAPIGGQSAPETVAFYSYTASVMVDQVRFADGLGEQSPVINRVIADDGQLIFSGTNGFSGDAYYLLSSTNLASGPWTVGATNTFDANGAFSITNPVISEMPQMFYRLQVQ